MKNKNRFDLRKLETEEEPDGKAIYYNGERIIKIDCDLMEWLESDVLLKKKNRYVNHPLMKEILDSGWTMSGFCEECLINKNTLYNVLRGTHTPTEYTVRQLAKGLNVSVEKARDLCGCTIS